MTFWKGGVKNVNAVMFRLAKGCFERTIIANIMKNYMKKKRLTRGMIIQNKFPL